MIYAYFFKCIFGLFFKWGGVVWQIDLLFALDYRCMGLFSVAASAASLNASI